MELSSNIFTKVLSPLAAFTRREEPACEDDANQSRDGDPTADDDPRWGASFLNPQSRIDGLTPSFQPTWRVDGVDVDGRRVFAVPEFGVGRPPLRIDVYLPPLEDYPVQLRGVLRPEALLCSSRSAVPMSPVMQHLLRALERWSSRLPGFESQYLSMPFGSQILVTNMAANLDEMSLDMHLRPSYDVEQAMESAESLQRMWNLPESAWPPFVEWENVQFERQLHESITLVSLSGKPTHPSDIFVLKSLTRDQRYMYNELKMLLTLPPHPSIIPRPAYVVTKRGRFGGKRGVCGFLIEYFPLGSLKHRLHHVNSGGLPQISPEEQFRWSKQVISALIHINKHPAGFYPDLKPDNVVLRLSNSVPGQIDAVLLDLEQRGGWYSWSPPEVAYLEYLEVLVSGLEEEDPDVSQQIQQRFETKLPGWSAGSQHDRYRNSDGGFSAPWLALLQKRKDGDDLDLERAQVFMLGKLLWCIFEGTPFVRCGIDHELLQDNSSTPETRLRFPEFRRTPQGLRDLIRRCTEGAPEWEQGRVTNVLELQGGKLVARDGRDTQLVASEYWAAEIDRAKAFLDGLGGDSARPGEQVVGSAGSSQEGIARRPTLLEVQRELERVDISLGGKDSRHA
ncbi:hypothetical protein B0T16DRAFT_421473 [Cercophora newfieldiana]|uniref:Protein kinase domain-containing protein n=1 Tax=Cercophora newfieldiana TaxID=92897 RepID=A0AA39XS28_9PEZI|nr:hypothetical protein B0T16DRAFT_421473 [Cercophora newfieldiana]